MVRECYVFYDTLFNDLNPSDCACVVEVRSDTVVRFTCISCDDGLINFGREKKRKRSLNYGFFVCLCFFSFLYFLTFDYFC